MNLETILIISSLNAIFFLVIILLVVLVSRGRGEKTPYPSENEYLGRPKNPEYMEGGPEQDPYLSSSISKSKDILNRAVTQAKKLLVDAELESMGLTDKQREEYKRIDAEYRQRLEEIFKELKQNLESQVGQTNHAYVEFIESLKNRATQEGAALNEVESKILEQSAKFSESLSSFDQKAAEQNKGFLASLDAFRQKARESLNGTLLTFEQSLKELERDGREKSGTAEGHYVEFLAGLQQKAEEEARSRETLMSKKFDSIFAGGEGLFKSFITELGNRTKTQLDEEIGSARRVVEQYKEQRLEVVDANIVAILEKTLNITLGKKLTLADQTKLVYEALEEAKKENFFA